MPFFIRNDVVKREAGHFLSEGPAGNQLLSILSEVEE